MNGLGSLSLFQFGLFTNRKPLVTTGSDKSDDQQTTIEASDKIELKGKKKWLETEIDKDEYITEKENLRFNKMFEDSKRNSISAFMP